MVLDVITPDECWRLLATQHVGRLALSIKALPALLPVQYYVDGGAIAVCLGHHQLPATSLDDAVSAFAADAVDPVARSGWSVQVLGRLQLSPQPEFDAACGHEVGAQIVIIEPKTITGQWIALCPLIDVMQRRNTPSDTSG